MAEDAVPGSQTQRKTARRVRRFSLLSECLIFGSAAGVIAGWLLIIFAHALFFAHAYGTRLRLGIPYTPRFDPLLFAEMSGAGGLLGICGLLGGLSVWLAIRLWCRVRRPKAPV
jgi:hypothetical protein